MKIAILGMGTVGGGVLKVLQSLPTPHNIEVKYIFAREVKDSTLDLTGITLTDNIDSILNSDVDLIVEVLGGVDFPYEIHQKAILKGKHVVTANKDLLALYLDQLARLANEKKVQIGFEASCGGGIPIIQPMQWNLNANHLTKVMGILNGTTNYILTKMSNDHWDYQEALVQAQLLGYAEKDPTNDVCGFDTRRKIVILSRLAYDKQICVEDVNVRGIESIELTDILNAEKLGYRIKLVGRSEYYNGEVAISVEPVMLPQHHMLARTELEKNAIYIEGDAVGQTMFYGPGAGSLETASAVVSDILFIDKFGFIGNKVPNEHAVINNNQYQHQYYLRLTNGQNQVDDYHTLLLEKGEDIYITVPISTEQLSYLLAELSVEAYYLIEGE